MIQKRLNSKKADLYKSQGKLWKLKKHDPEYKAVNRKVNQLIKVIGNLEFLLKHQDKFDKMNSNHGVCKSAMITYDTLQVKFYGLEGTFNYSKGGVLKLLNRNAIMDASGARNHDQMRKEHQCKE